MRILVGCEESQAVTKECRKLGHEAYSCDILDCSGGKPEWHIKGDILNILNDDWNMLIAFPPCTHLATSGAQHFPEKIKDGRQQQGIDFFMALINAPINRIAVENPIGIMSTVYRKPDQLIQPWQFGDEAQKTTCLWLKNLPKLYHNDRPNLFDDKVTHVSKGEFYEFKSKTGEKKKMPKWYYEAFKNAKSPEERKRLRSKTFPGIAQAMANQWTKGSFLDQLELFKK
jgi:hypothetical protein